MEKVFGALKRRIEARKICLQNSTLDWTALDEGVESSFRDCIADFERRERKLVSESESVAARALEVELLRESLEGRLNDFEKRVEEFNLYQEAKNREYAMKERELSVRSDDFEKEVRLREGNLDDKEKFLHGFIEKLEVSQSEIEETRIWANEKLKEIESRERDVEMDRKYVSKRKRKVDSMQGELRKRLKVLERREDEFDSFREGKMEKMALKEEKLNLQRKEFVREIKSAYEKLREREKLAEDKLQSMKEMVDERLKETESQGNWAQERLASSLEEANLSRESFEKRFKEFEEMIKEFNSFQQEKLLESESKEQELNVMRRKMKFSPCLIEMLESVQYKVEGLKTIADKIFAEILSGKGNVNVACGTTVENLIREPMKKLLSDTETREENLCSLQGNEMEDLVSKENFLGLMRKEFTQDVKLKGEKLKEQEKVVLGLLERLEWVYIKAKNMKTMVSEKHKNLVREETNLNSMKDWIEGKMDEVDCKAKELEEKEREIRVKEDNAMSEQNELARRKGELEMMEHNLDSWKNEIELKEKKVNSEQKFNEQRLEELEGRENNLNSVREFTRTCYKEYRALKKQLLSEKQVVEKLAGDLELKEQELECRQREVELKEKKIVVHFKELELRQQIVINAFDADVRFVPDKSVDIKFTVTMDGKTLQMFVNDCEKDLELLGNEVLKVLHLSSNPAKLVLDAMEGFYPPHLREGDVGHKVRSTCILLLEQLRNMSPHIEPFVREEAIKLAFEWKEKMRFSAENPFEVLGFLHLLDAYNLGACFDSAQALSLLEMVAQDKQSPDLRLTLGIMEDIHEEHLQSNDLMQQDPSSEGSQ